jgi:hypothetical protein
MYRIRRFGVIRTATIVAVLYMIVVAIFFVPIALIGALVGAAYTGDAVGGGAGLIGTALLGLVFAVGYGVAGWVFTAISCLLYNLAAGWVGGIEVQVDRVDPTPAAVPAWTTAAPPPGAPPVG